jgi:uncharacterized membrane protein YgaE (UPF0421/DUF939 family)
VQSPSALFKRLAPNAPYIFKCLVGATLCYFLYIRFPQYPFFWAIISVVLAVPTDNSNRTAFDYLKSNFLGCAVGLGLSLFHLPELVALCLGVGLTIVIGIGVKLTAPLRPALAAIVVVTITEQKQGQWVPVERVACVATGCVVALLVSLLVNLAVRGMSGKETAGLPNSQGQVK